MREECRGNTDTFLYLPSLEKDDGEVTKASKNKGISCVQDDISREVEYIHT